MHFTHSTSGHEPCGAFVGSSLQIYSIKVAKIENDSGLSWPLQVYGVVAARDTVDRNRNILFSRQRNNCQVITPQVSIVFFFSIFCFLIRNCTYQALNNRQKGEIAQKTE
jgi:hypothetical protein